MPANPMNDRLQELADKIIDRSFVMVDAGDMKSLNWAVKSVIQLSTHLPKLASQQPEAPAVDHEVAIERLLSGSGYEDDDWDLLRRSRITTADAAKFAGISTSTIRGWCKAGSIVCEQDPNRDRVTWLICPRSVALRINNIPDPRIRGAE